MSEYKYFIDALIASHPAVVSGTMTVVSYDRDFDKLGVKRVEPSEVLKSIKDKWKKRSNNCYILTKIN